MTDRSFYVLILLEPRISAQKAYDRDLYNSGDYSAISAPTTFLYIPWLPFSPSLRMQATTRQPISRQIIALIIPALMEQIRAQLHLFVL